jgi:hypothetical protein
MEQHMKLALHIFKWYAREWAKYDEECAEYANKGFRPHRCFHGMNLWTDYDPICGPCEDGYSWFDPELYRKLALGQAKDAYKKFDERLDLYVKASTAGLPMDYSKTIPWVSEPLNYWGPFTVDAQAEAIIALNPPF